MAISKRFPALKPGDFFQPRAHRMPEHREVTWHKVIEVGEGELTTVTRSGSRRVWTHENAVMRRIRFVCWEPGDTRADVRV